MSLIIIYLFTHLFIGTPEEQRSCSLWKTLMFSYGRTYSHQEQGLTV